MDFNRMLSATNISASGLSAERLRMEVVANNIANASATRDRSRLHPVVPQTTRAPPAASGIVERINLIISDSAKTVAMVELGFDLRAADEKKINEWIDQPSDALRQMRCRSTRSRGRPQSM